MHWFYDIVCFFNCYLSQSTQKIIETMPRFSNLMLVSDKMDLVESFESFEKVPSSFQYKNKIKLTENYT